jgi:branched-chain amino acid transport system ATP-binding protein
VLHQGRRVTTGTPAEIERDPDVAEVYLTRVDEILQALRRYAADAAVLIVEQHLDLAMELAQSAVVLRRGEVVMRGAPAELRADPQLLAHLAP